MSPSLPSRSSSSSLLPCFGPTLSDLTFLPLDGLWTWTAPELRLQLDHAGPDGVTFTAGLVALRPLGPFRDHAVDGWKRPDDSNGQPLLRYKVLRSIQVNKMKVYVVIVVKDSIPTHL